MRLTKWAGLSIFVILAVWILTASFAGNFFKAGEPYNPQQWRPRVFNTFQTDSEMSVTVMLQKTRRDGLFSTCGLMMFRTIDDPPYYSAFGLQGQFFSLLYAVSQANYDAFVQKARFGTSLFFALIIAGLGIWIWREIGPTAAIFLILLTAVSDWLVFVARNLYCMYPLNFVPMVAALWLFPFLLKNGRFKEWHYLVIIGALIFIKSLCYYDYITNIILSTAVAPLYYGITRQLSPGKVIRLALLGFAAGALGTVLAIAANIIQVSIYSGSLSEGFSQIIGRAASRMYGGADSAHGAPPGVTALQLLEYSMTLPAMSIPFQQLKMNFHLYLTFFAFYAAMLPAMLFSLLDGRIFPEFDRERRKTVGFAVITLWGLLASVSWGLLMKGHMAHHTHMNGMMFYIPYMLLLYALFGKIAAVAVRQITYFIRARQWPALDPVNQTQAGTIPAGKNKKN